MLTGTSTKLILCEFCVPLFQPHAITQMLVFMANLPRWDAELEKSPLWGRETCNTSSIRGIKTDKQSNNQTSGLQKYHTHRWWKSRSALWQRPYEPWQNVWKKILWPVNKLSQPYLCCGMWNTIFWKSFFHSISIIVFQKYPVLAL